MPRVRVEYFAILREERGCTDEWLDTAATTPAELYAELQQQHRLSLPTDMLKIVVNEEFSTWDVPLSENDTVVYIAPVAGG